MGRLTKRQREVKDEWFAHTGFEFLGPDPGESFYRALQRNRKWLEDHTNDALRIGSDIFQPEDDEPRPLHGDHHGDKE